MSEIVVNKNGLRVKSSRVKKLPDLKSGLKTGFWARWNRAALLTSSKVLTCALVKLSIVTASKVKTTCACAAAVVTCCFITLGRELTQLLKRKMDGRPRVAFICVVASTKF
jgi:hypothetical protein